MLKNTICICNMRCFLSLILLLCALKGSSQDGMGNCTLEGYVKDLQMFYYVKPLGEWTNQNTVHNRLNFKWYASSSFTVAVEMRNRLVTGKLVSDFSKWGPIDYGSVIDQDNGFWNLSHTLSKGSDYVLHSMIDRAYVDYSSGNWQLRLGRQRINWGMNLIWNPNDLFNTYSFIDFDYEERPGTDALKVQYYLGATSSAEIVYQPGDDIDQMALAARFVFNKWNYDFQILGGWVQEDMVVGVGWAGDIQGAGFRGEISWFTPRKGDDDDVCVASLSADYSFQNNLYLHAGGLFNSSGQNTNVGSLDFLGAGERSPKQLSQGKYALFGQISYPITPLWNSTISSIVNPADGSIYLGPSLSYSILENIDLMLMGQLFTGNENTEYGDLGQAIYLRAKWSF